MTTGSTQVTELRVHGVRWYLLSVVSLHCCLQNAVWAAFPPIAQSAKLVYDWTDSDINMSLIYGNIGTIVLLLPMIWIVFAKGMRTALLLSTFLTAIGTALKALPVGNNLNSWLIPIGLFLNGCGGAVTSVGATVLSETWFPPSQRATATVFYLVSAAVGGALVFIVVQLSRTVVNLSDFSLSKQTPTSTQCDGEHTETGAEGGSENSSQGMEILAFGTVLCHFHFSIRIMANDCGSCATSIWHITSRLSDIFHRKMKVIMMAMFSIATVFFLLFILMLIEVVPNEHWLFYFAYIAACVMTSGAQPLYYEIACENLFPVSEAVISGFLAFLLNVGSSLFLLVTLIPGIGTMWPNWAVFVTSLLSVVVLYLFKEEYRRLDIDLPVSQSEDSDPEHNRF
uniref:Disrupted in renal carcinoma protein 2-like protein n=1 Tax=Magallana gigas TaxID=29159 RepID=K1RTJ9_MAGGI